MSWLEGGLPARGLIAAAGASGVLAAVVLTQALAPGRVRSPSILDRLRRVAFASGVCAGAWALLDLVGWL